MRTFAKLFGQSPILPLQAHMEQVAKCIAKARELFAAFREGDHEAVERLAGEVSELEHEADEVKHDIRNNLPSSIFMPVDRSRIQEILKSQDNIADRAQNIGALMTFKPLRVPEWMMSDFDAFVEANFATFDAVRAIIQQLDELMETGFGGEEAERVLRMVGTVAERERQVDRLQRRLIKSLYAHDVEMTVGEFVLWTDLLKETSELSDLSLRVANRVRRTLQLKR